jgi:hypothetical protein
LNGQVSARLTANGEIPGERIEPYGSVLDSIPLASQKHIWKNSQNIKEKN